MSHTPGPWRVDQTDRCEVLTADNRFRVLLTTVAAGAVHEEWKANAQLIAAAPDLLAALKAVIANHCANTKLFCSTCSPARAIIAKVEGGS